MKESTFNLIYLIVIAIIACFGFLIPWLKKRNQRIPNIIAEEKKRREHPDVQSGKFTRLYTMPYCEDVNGQNISAYFKEHYPDYECTHTETFVRVNEKSSDEVRELTIIQLPHEDITAIELVDPHEIVSDGRYAYHTRTSLHDLGFGDNVRKVVRLFQEQAVAHKRV
jgi:hypothetical protein